MPQSYFVAGNLPFENQGAGLYNALASGSVSDLASHYAQAYRAALDMNRQNYANVMSGYQRIQGLNAVDAARGGRDYRRIMEGVLGEIQNYGQSQRDEIGDSFGIARGQADQDLISRGLGNSTVTSSVQRGLTLDEQKANTQLADRLAEMRAGYRTQLSMAGQAYKERQQQQQLGTALSQLQFMNSVSANYPDAAAYTQLANMLGGYGQAAADREQAMAMARMQQGAAGGMGGFGGGGGGGGSRAAGPAGGTPYNPSGGMAWMGGYPSSGASIAADPFPRMVKLANGNWFDTASQVTSPNYWGHAAGTRELAVQQHQALQQGRGGGMGGGLAAAGGNAMQTAALFGLGGGGDNWSPAGYLGNAASGYGALSSLGNAMGGVLGMGIGASLGAVSNAYQGANYTLGALGSLGSAMGGPIGYALGGMGMLSDMGG
jgi:hypothetical protein